MKNKKDNILKKFIAVLTVLLCLFGLSAGIVTAKGNTSGQLSRTYNEKIDEADVIEFLTDKFSGA